MSDILFLPYLANKFKAYKMNCGESGCPNEPIVICSVHSIKFCGNHYAEHCIDCTSKAIKLDPFKELRVSQIKSLNKKVAQIKSQIVGLANKLVLSIQESLKNSLDSLDKQKAVLIEIIQKGKPENQINELLGIFPSKISGGQNSIQSLTDLEPIFSLNDFKAKVQEIENKFMPKEVVLPKPRVNPVLESLEKLDSKGKIAWFREQNYVMIDSYIREIKITKDASFVFICMN